MKMEITLELCWVRIIHSFISEVLQGLRGLVVEQSAVSGKLELDNLMDPTSLCTAIENKSLFTASVL